MKLSYPNQSRGASFLSQAKVVPSCERRGLRNDNPGVNQSSHNIFGKCVVCNGLHQLWNCEEFKRKPYAERIKILREHKLCDNCFKVGHTARGCLQRSACYIEGCNKKHMTVIHPPQLSLPDHVYTDRSCEVEPSSFFARNRPNQSYAARYSVGSSRDAATQGHITVADVNTSGNFSTQSHAIGAGTSYHGNRNQPTSTRICLRIVPVRVHDNNSGRILETYALLDNGSDVSLCDAELVKELDLQGERRDFLLTTQETKDSAKSGLELKLTISSLDGTSALEIQRVWTVDRLNVLSRSIPRAEDVQVWSHLSDIELPEIQNKDVRVLIGCNVPEAFWVMEERRGKRGEPIAVRSLLGWTLMGPTENHQEDSKFSVNFVRLEDGRDSRDEALLSQVEKFWKTDFVDTLSSTKVAMSVEDEKALKLMEDSVVKVSGHYQVALPWRFQPPYLSNNRIAAEKGLQLLRNKFRRDEEFFRKYKDTIDDYIAKGYAHRVPDEQLDVIDKPLWYLPHHAVFHSRKPDKLRIVFDCAAKFRGTFLNDQLMHGPDLTNNLFGVLNRFRQEAIALVSDIEGMFHQVKVDTKDYDALRFLWWQDGDLTQQPVEYRMVVHLFGSTSSPSCASFCLRKTALDNEGDFGHHVIDTVLKNFYVDDCLKTVSSKAVAVQLRIDLCHLLSRGGFRLTKWLCNDKDVLETIPKFERARSVLDLDLSNQNLPHERTLGVQWNMDSDTFTFKVEPKHKPFTRRGILSTTSSVYDPLGLVSPVIVPAKKLLQDLCQQKIGWNDEIALEELAHWRSWISGLPKLSQVAIPRHLKPADFGEVRSCHLHHFADASQVVYGAVAYVRFESANRQIHCSFLASKSRLAHVKPMTIPRLELSAAVLAVRIDRSLREELEFTIDKSVFWSDSTSVLQYIRNQDKRFRTFVANRLAVIRDGSQPTQWKYVPTSDNPADLVSRGTSVEELIHQSRWFSGPKFLWKEESSWPTMP
ncbi:uncharacterized protein [Acropora muricata]|uniref:uncharacterized protein n=1 Tax=Acropora muricata TaxID=159855 RepID=UPI0034E4F97C